MSQASGKWMARAGPAVVLAFLACSVTHASGWDWGGGPGRGGWGPWGMESLSSTATSSTINIGTLALGIYVAAAKLLVWMGAANKTVNPGKNQEKNRKNLDKATP